MRTYRLQIRLIQFSVVLSLMVVVAGFFGVWGSRPSEQAVTEPTTEDTRVKLENTKIVALGDSYTYGYPGTPKDSWPEVLGKTLEISVVNKGKISQLSKDLLSRFEADVLSENPGRVIIFAGNGDALNEVSLETFQTQIRAMVERAEANHIIPVLALPMPYPSVQKEIKELREWELSYAQEKKITVLDFASVMMDAENKYLKGYSENGKYPTEKGYQVMGEYAARVLE
jgi:lysophospholipase L1-like esterase